MRIYVCVCNRNYLKSQTRVQLLSGINQPVIDLTTRKVEITAHNHGFAVAAPKEVEFHTVYGSGRVSHISLNDSVVEGLHHWKKEYFL